MKISSYRFSNCSHQQNYALLLWLREILSAFWCCRFRKILAGSWLKMLMIRKHILYLLCACTLLIYLYIHSVQRLTVAIISENRLENSKGLAHICRLILLCHKISCRALWAYFEQEGKRNIHTVLNLFNLKKSSCFRLTLYLRGRLFLFSFMSEKIINNETVPVLSPYLRLIWGYLLSCLRLFFTICTSRFPDKEWPKTNTDISLRSKISLNPDLQ